MLHGVGLIIIVVGILGFIDSLIDPMLSLREKYIGNWIATLFIIVGVTMYQIFK